MEFWWWIEPLFWTGVVCFGLAILFMQFCDSLEIDGIIPVTIIIILIIPPIVFFVCFIANIIVGVFYSIWAPYL